MEQNVTQIQNVLALETIFWREIGAFGSASQLITVPNRVTKHNFTSHAALTTALLIDETLAAGISHWSITN